MAEFKSEVDPVVVARHLSGDHSHPTTRAERVLICRQWVASGRPLRQVEEATGWPTHRYIDKEGA